MNFMVDPCKIISNLEKNYFLICNCRAFLTKQRKPAEKVGTCTLHINMIQLLVRVRT